MTGQSSIIPGCAPIIAGAGLPGSCGAVGGPPAVEGADESGIIIAGGATVGGGVTTSPASTLTVGGGSAAGCEISGWAASGMAAASLGPASAVALSAAVVPGSDTPEFASDPAAGGLVVLGATLASVVAASEGLVWPSRSQILRGEHT